MTIRWDESADLVVIGSGGGGLVAGLTAARSGLRAVVLEKGGRFGGSTAMSGGILWLPGNPYIDDSIEAGRTYLDALIGDDDPASTPARREAFLQGALPMIAMLRGAGIRFYACDGYSDYYDELPGGRPRGRSLGAEMIAARRMGDLQDRLLTLPGWNMPVKTDEFARLSLANRTLSGKVMALKAAWRSLRQRFEGTLYFRGAALQARLLLAARDRGVELRAEAPVRELIYEDGRVAGVRVQAGEGDRFLRAERGVVVAAGGFARNAAMRRDHQPEPAGADWTLANPGDTGDLIGQAMALGAAVHHMDQSWWLPVSLKANGTIGGFHSPQEMQKPYGIAVNARGERFVNESASYMEIGQVMYASGSVPAWIVMEARHRRFYPWGAVPPRVMPPSWLKSGYMKRAGTLCELAGLCGIDADGLERTVARFNAFAAEGRDADFGRGARAYDRFYGDPRVTPNASLGPIAEAPFYAVQIVPGDVGTAGGLAADEHARVLRGDGSVIPGLYACGNGAAPVFGRWYPGPGASIAASCVFGHLAARHAAGV